MKYFENHGRGTLVEEAQPSVIRRQATQMTTVATRMDTISDMLHKVSTQGTWESPAGDDFAAKVGATPSDLNTIANRLRGAAEIIRPYADQLESAQRTVASWDTKAHTAQKTMKAKDTELDELSAEDPDRVRVTKERGEAAAELNRAERGFEKAVKEAVADESRMAKKLYDLSEKDADPRGYDYLEWMTNFGEDASRAGILAKPVALFGVAKPIGLAGRRIAYDEGSMGEIGKASAGYALDTVGFGAGRVVKAAKRRFDGKPVGRVSGLSSNPVRVQDNPIIKATPPRASTKAAARGKAPVIPKKRQYDPVPSKVPVGVRDLAWKKSGAADISQAFDDWEAVAGAGRVAKVAVVVEHSAKHGNRVRRTTTGTAGALNGSGVTQKGQEQEEAERRKRANAKKMTEKEPGVDDLVTTPIPPPTK